jgi:DNA ligase-1
MKFKRLAEYFEKIEKEASRLAMTRDLAELFKEVSEEEIDQVIYLALGNLRPKFEGVEFNLAEKMMVRVLGVAYGVEIEKARKAFKQTGDLGGAIERLGVKESRGKGLSVAEVYKRLFEVAVDEGQGSQGRKVQSMARLIKDLDILSAKYVMRIPVNKLRLGFSDMTVLDGLSWMAKGDKSLRTDLERAFNVSADIGKIARVFKKKGLQGIAGIKAEPGIPIRMAMAERLPSAEKMVEKLEVFAVEPKYDGLRVQIHVDKGKHLKLAGQEDLFGKAKKFVRIFSRNLDNVTHMFPDIVEEAEKLKVRTVILDGEAIAYNPKTGKFLPFQVTVQRKRKHGVKEKMRELPLKVMVYDLLLVDGRNVMNKPFKERRRELEKVMKGMKGELVLAEQDVVSDTKQLRILVKKYLSEGLEGAMCKKLTTVYQAGSRNFNWVKFKKTTEEGVVDTLDCVVMGYYAGKGRRSGFGIGAFLVGVRQAGKIGTVAKIGTGLSDEQWREMKKRGDKVAVKEKPKGYEVDKNLKPDVWCSPKMVVEILADEITKSPIHSFGLALRFPRLVKFRDDKQVSQATTKGELEKFFKMQ